MFNEFNKIMAIIKSPNSLLYKIRDFSSILNILIFFSIFKFKIKGKSMHNINKILIENIATRHF